MDPKIKELFQPEILQEIADHYQIAGADLKALDGFESFIYEFEKDDQAYILRVGHSLHRGPDEVQGEAEFIEYLAQHGLHVGRPMRNESGDLIKAVPAAEGIFSGVVFEKVPGSHATREDWNDLQLSRKLGRLLGKMHMLAKDFVPSAPHFQRLDWEQDILECIEVMKKGLTAEDEPVIQVFNETAAQVRSLPRGRDNYGIIHFDVHSGNFFLHDGSIYLFDFDDCQYSWFANDIAMVFFYASPLHFQTKEQVETVRQRCKAFFEGYAEENEINPLWLQYLQAFLTLREIDLYARIQHDIPEEEYDDWCRTFLDGRREKILSRTPYIPLDFPTLLPLKRAVNIRLVFLYGFNHPLTQGQNGISRTAAIF